MRFFLSRYGGAGTNASPFRPAGAEQAEASRLAWYSIDLRPDATKADGWAVVAVDGDIAGAAGRVNLGSDLDAQLSPTARRSIADNVGRTFEGRSLREILPELLLGRGLEAERRGSKTKVHAIHLGGLVWEQPVVAGGAGYTDDFNRAALGANWTAVNGGWAISASTRLARSAIGVNRASVRYALPLDSADHYSQIDFVDQGGTTNGWMGPAVRFDAAADTYYMAFSRAAGGLRKLDKVVAGTVTELASSAGGGGPSRTLRLDVSGSTLNFYDNGVLALTATDTSITGNVHVGVQCHPTSAGVPRGDNFAASDLVALTAYALKFDLSPDATRTGGGGNTATIRVKMVVDGVETDLGIATSPPETLPNGEYTWGAREMSVTGVFDPDADEVYVRWRHEAGLDTGYVRLLHVERPSDAEVWRDQYGTWAPLTDSPTFDGGTPPGQKDPCDVAGTWLVDPYGDGYVRHLLIPPFDPSTCEAGWVIGFVPMG